MPTRLPLRLVPKDAVVPIVQGPVIGMGLQLCRARIRGTPRVCIKILLTER
jgi:hypothetical protein